MYKPYDEYKNCGLLWVEKIPNDWQVNRIQDLLVQRKERNLPIKTTQILSLYASKGVVPYKDKGQAGNKAKDDLTLYNLAYPNDLIVNCMNVVAGSVGLSKYFGAISPVYYALYNRNESLNILFCNYVFQLEPFQKSLLGLGNGILMHKTEEGKLHTVRMRIPMQKLKNVQLPLPSIPEQEKIAKFLDWKLSKINKYIKSKKKMITLLKEQKQAIINQAVTKGLDPSTPTKPSGIDWLGDIPTHWETKPLKREFILNPSISFDNDDQIVTFLPMEKVTIDGLIDNSEKRKINDVKSGFTSFSKNDVIIAKITPCFENGKGACLSELETSIGYGSTEFIVLKAKPTMIPQYLYYITKSSQFRILGSRVMTGSAGQKRVPSSFVQNFVLGIPSKTEQSLIIKHIEVKTIEINKALFTIQKQLSLMTEYRTTLISDAVTGKIDVRDIEVPLLIDGISEDVEESIELTEESEATLDD